jgi:predicted MFS family arabinose efflux permease
MAAVMVGKLFSDMFLGMVPAIIPTLQEYFGLTLTLCIVLTACLHISANAIQLFVGHLRPHRSKPVILFLGAASISAVALVGLLPASPRSFWGIALLVVVTGCGNGMYNPEAMRAVHRLRRISSPMSSSLFVASALIGYATGSWLGPVLVTTFGLKGLLLMVAGPLASIVFFRLMRLRLHVERPEDRWQNVRKKPARKLPLWPIILMAVIAALSSHVFGWLLPAYITDLGLGQVFGGFSMTVWCVGAAFGAFLWTYVAKNKGDLVSAISALLSGVPLIVCYLLTIERRAAVVLLLIGGLGSPSAFAMMVSMARNAAGGNLGQRVALIIGGVWGTSALIMPVSAVIIKTTGTFPVLCFVPVGYTLAAGVGIILLIRMKRANAELNGTAH